MAKRGRPSGSTSFVRIDMAKLNELFKQQHHIPVSRVWLREQGYDLQDSNPVPISASVKSEDSEKVDENIDFKIQL